MDILVCGGDSRQIYTARALEEQGFCVQTVLLRREKEPDIKKQIRSCDALVLPLPVSRDGKTVNAPFAEEKLPLDSVSALTGSGQIILGGMLPFALCERLYEKGAAFFDYYKDEQLISANAVPTAEGVLGILIGQTPKTVCTSRYLITGFGRCGKACAGLLLKNGAKITVAARSDDARRQAEAMGCRTMHTDALYRIGQEYDAVVNTVPYRILTEPILRRLGRDTLLVEISSAPFGIDFEAAQALELPVVKASSLPGKVSPQTAGIIIADSVARRLRKEGFS